MLQNYLLEHGAQIGNDVFFGTNIYIDEGFERFLEIEDGVVISHGVSILLHDSSINNIMQRPIKVGKVKICKNVYLGANTTILCGVQIGENSLIGAGSLVTKNITKNTLAYGVPAKEICHVSDLKVKNEIKNTEQIFYWDVIRWKDRQKKMNSFEEQNLYLLQIKW